VQIEFQLSFDYEFVEKEHEYGYTESHTAYILVFFNIFHEEVADYRKSFCYWLDRDYDILYDRDYKFTMTDYGTHQEGMCSIALWFNNPEHFTMLKLANG